MLSQAKLFNYTFYSLFHSFFKLCKLLYKLYYNSIFPNTAIGPAGCWYDKTWTYYLTSILFPITFWLSLYFIVSLLLIWSITSTLIFKLEFSTYLSQLLTTMLNTEMRLIHPIYLTYSYKLYLVSSYVVLQYRHYCHKSKTPCSHLAPLEDILDLWFTTLYFSKCSLSFWIIF